MRICTLSPQSGEILLKGLTITLLLLCAGILCLFSPPPNLQGLALIHNGLLLRGMGLAVLAITLGGSALAEWYTLHPQKQ